MAPDIISLPTGVAPPIKMDGTDSHTEVNVISIMVQHQVKL